MRKAALLPSITTSFATGSTVNISHSRLFADNRNISNRQLQQYYYSVSDEQTDGLLAAAAAVALLDDVRSTRGLQN